MPEPDWDAYPNFKRYEFVCRCGCGRADMDPAFMSWLQTVRSTFGKAMIVSSGFRCPEYNNQISTTGLDGPHTTGKAVDILCHRPEVVDLLDVAVRQGVTGIGANQKGDFMDRFLHLDTLLPIDGHPRPALWTYD